MIKGIIFDFNRTIYNPETDSLNSGALELLDALKEQGYKMCLLSKKTREDRKEQISRLGIEKYFAGIQVCEEDKTEEDFKKCSQAMEMQNSDIAVIGDRIRSEIIMGKRLGMKTIWYKSGKFASETPRNYKEEPDYTVISLEDALKALQNFK